MILFLFAIFGIGVNRGVDPDGFAVVVVVVVELSRPIRLLDLWQMRIGYQLY